jgi:hypothetical protein
MEKIWTYYSTIVFSYLYLNWWRTVFMDDYTEHVIALCKKPLVEADDTKLILFLVYFYAKLLLCLFYYLATLFSQLVLIGFL